MANNESTSTFQRLFSAGLGPRGRAASWVVALAGAVSRYKQKNTFHVFSCFILLTPQGAWMYWENQPKKAEPLKEADISKFNKKRKKQLEIEESAKR